MDKENERSILAKVSFEIIKESVYFFHKFFIVFRLKTIIVHTLCNHNTKIIWKFATKKT